MLAARERVRPSFLLRSFLPSFFPSSLYVHMVAFGPATTTILSEVREERTAVECTLGQHSSRGPPPTLLRAARGLGHPQKPQHPSGSGPLATGRAWGAVTAASQDR